MFFAHVLNELTRCYGRQGNLSLALQSLTGVPPASQLIYLPSGEQLREENAEELLAAPDIVSFSLAFARCSTNNHLDPQSLYVFNRDLLDAGNNPPAELLVAADKKLPSSGVCLSSYPASPVFKHLTQGT